MVRAGTPATRPADETAAADEAAVWLRLFSRRVNGRAPARARPRHAANAISAAVTDMLFDQPILRPL